MVYFGIVYDIHTYNTEKMRNFGLPKKTEDTLRIGVLSPMMIGIPQQNKDILKWAIDAKFLPETWYGSINYDYVWFIPLDPTLCTFGPNYNRYYCNCHCVINRN